MGKTNLTFLFTLLSIIGYSQVITPFSIRYQTTQKGGIVYLANAAVSCAANPTTVGGSCQTGSVAVPPSGTYRNNDFNAAYVDIDGNSTTFQSSSDSLALSNCSSISFAGLYWGAIGGATQGNANVKLRVNNGSYQTIVADQKFVNTTGYNSYHNFKNITSIVQAAGTNARFTVADIPTSGIGSSNVWGSWNIVVVYKNELMNMRQLTVFDGLVNVSGTTTVNVPLSGFLTPPTGPITFEIGNYTHDGDRSSTGDQLLFNGGSGFLNISDALNPTSDVMNSTVSRNGILTPFRLPNLNNTVGLDADIFSPNNSTKNYIGNAVSSATLRVTSGGEIYLTQMLTTAIDVYEPDLRVDKKVFDRFGNNAFNQIVAPGDTVTYRLTIYNLGSDTSTNSFVTDSLTELSNFVPNSIRYTYGPFTGSKTDVVLDDQAEYNGASKKLMFRIGLGANSSTGGKVANSSTGADSTVITYKATATRDCFLLKCDNKMENRAFSSQTGLISGNTFVKGSNPAAFDINGCPISGSTDTYINISSVSCSYPSDTAISVCSNNLPTFTSIYTRQGYTTFQNSAFITVTSPTSTGTYYAIRTAYTGCTDTVVLNVTVTTPNAGVNQTVCRNATATMAATGIGTWVAQAGNPASAVITTPNSPTTTITSLTVAGTYNFIYTTNGCADTASVIVKSTSTSTTNVSICPSALPYSWNGSRNAAGTYTFTTTNSQGCDSVATLNLTVKTNTTSTTNVSICPSQLPYSWNGSRSAAGTYTFTTTNSQGCDSVA
ncbi:MAG: hypothetical protein ACOVO1_12265, partial [Chitinophagaceae bacterium]